MRSLLLRSLLVVRPWILSGQSAYRGFSSATCSTGLFGRSSCISVLYPWPLYARHEDFSSGIIRTKRKTEQDQANASGMTSSRSSTEDEEEKFPFELKRINLRVCHDLYAEMHFEKGVKAPPLGIDIDLAYVDTGYPDAESLGEDRLRRLYPTVLCLHGAGGSHKDLAGVIVALAARGARVLCPIFPGVGPTPLDEGRVYTHSAIENCHLILDFLRALRVARIDQIVAFSAGCYPAVGLSSNTAFPIRSVALLQVPGHRPYRAIRPFWLLKRGVRLMSLKWIRTLFAPVLYLRTKMMGRSAVSASVELAHVMGQVSVGVDFDTYARTAAELPFSRLPLLLTFSQDDQFVEPEISYEFANIVGLPAERLMRYDGDGNLVRRGAPRLDPDFYLKGIVFEHGGHFAQKKEPTASLIEKAVCELFDHVKRINERRTADMIRQDANLRAPQKPFSQRKPKSAAASP